MTMLRISLETLERKKRGSQMEFFLINYKLSLLRNFPPYYRIFFKNDHSDKSPPRGCGWVMPSTCQTNKNKKK